MILNQQLKDLMLFIIGLDLVMKQKACRLITQAANLNELNTIIVVTHDVTEGMSIADTVWLMGREKGIEGARILEEIDLAAKGLCWRPDIQQEEGFQAQAHQGSPRADRRG